MGLFVQRRNGSLNGVRFFLRALFLFPQFHLASVFLQSNAPNEISRRVFYSAESWFEDVYSLCRTRLMVFSLAQLILQSSEMCQTRVAGTQSQGSADTPFLRSLFSSVTYLMRQGQGVCERPLPEILSSSI